MEAIEDPGFDLLPTDDDEVPPEDDVDAAEAAALTEPDAEAELGEDAPMPYGRTWLFDFPAGRTQRQGAAPAETRGLGALRMWCLMAIYSARYAHGVFSDEFGMEHPEVPIGELPSDEAAADYGRRLEEALLVHDRVVAVENYKATVNPLEGVLEIETFDVVTDEDERIQFAGVMVPTDSGEGP